MQKRVYQLEDVKHLLHLVYENELEYKKHKGEKVYDTTGVFTHKNILFKLQKNFSEEKDVESFLNKTIHFNHILTVGDIKKSKEKCPQTFNYIYFTAKSK